MTVIRGQEAYSLALLRSQGKEAEAQQYLDALNMFPKAFGHELFEMPEPLSTGLPDLVSCPADYRAQVEREIAFTLELKRDAA